MGEVRVRRALTADALVVAALRLQAARAAGAPAEPGFLDRFAAAWDPDLFPTWVAERDGSHAGVLIAQLVTDLPWPGRAAGRRLHVDTLFSPVSADENRSGPTDCGIIDALTAAMTTWASDVGLTLAGPP